MPKHFSNLSYYLHSLGAKRAGKVPAVWPVKLPAAAPRAEHLQLTIAAGGVNTAAPAGKRVPAGAFGRIRNVPAPAAAEVSTVISPVPAAIRTLVTLRVAAGDAYPPA